MNAQLPQGVLGEAFAAGEPLQLLLRGIRRQAEGIHAFELAHPEGLSLPEVEAGAHVDVHLPGGVVRSYSLAGDPEDRSHWVLGDRPSSCSHLRRRRAARGVRAGRGFREFAIV